MQESERPDASESAETGKVSFKLDQAWGCRKISQILHHEQ